jgi:hypothetical protein
VLEVEKEEKLVGGDTRLRNGERQAWGLIKNGLLSNLITLGVTARSMNRENHATAISDSIPRDKCVTDPNIHVTVRVVRSTRTRIQSVKRATAN